jgi:rsbT co-antagonist protein RsbR
MDAQTVKRIALILTEHREAIVEAWATSVRESVRGRLGKSEVARQIEELYTGVQAALDGGATDIDSPQAADLLIVLADLSRARARQGFSATETAVSVFALKDALYASLPTRSAQSLADFAGFSLFVDRAGLYTFESYVNARDAIITEQSTQLLELSTPVVKLWDGVVAVPLIGTLDSARAQIVMERLLQSLVDTGSPFAILDITGVPAVDTQVAQHILKTVMAARLTVVAAQLMGAQCVISGIRPQIAQTIVSLGIEFGEIVTKASLSDALQYALREMGVELVRRPARPAL